MIDTFINSSNPRNRTWGQVLESYYQLTKPRIIVLLLITTAGGMWVAGGGRVDPLLMLATLAGGALASAAANTINCWYDRDIDYDMERTRHRPLPSGRVHPRDALLFAGLLAIASFGLLATYANLAAALLAMSGIGFYVAIYTLWLKRTSSLNIVIGGAAGAIPPLVGWAAVTGGLDWGAWALFLIIFLWTPPHFWALALLMRDEYAQVKVPMLPVVAGDKSTAQQMMVYTLLMVPATLLLVFPLHQLGWVYAIAALGLGEIFIRKNWQLLQQPEDRELARSLFKYSLYYMMLLCAAMGLDTLPLSQQLSSALSENWAAIAHL
ncbi:heme o synthase [Synechococcus sp. PCC 7336]|uniref:heme o synthase n=1 Tax=Synechococcus sp. PCC 7336 TaxID=195250 RepID=UPI00034D9F92|nr:heme o synthase [Synechococcus sp. PCC 7336]